MKKKIVSCLLAMSLIVSSGSYAFADRLDNDGDVGQTKVIKNLPSTYVVTIPDVIVVPPSSEKTGTEFNISAGESRLATNEYLKVNLIKGTDDNYNAADSYVELKNGSSTIYSPLRLTKADDGGSILVSDDHSQDDNKLYKINSANPVVACFGPDENGMATGASLTENGYKLYAYRAYINNALSDIAGDDLAADKLLAGDYVGTVTFQLKVANDISDIDFPNGGWQDSYDGVGV